MRVNTAPDESSVVLEPTFRHRYVIPSVSSSEKEKVASSPGITEVSRGSAITRGESMTVTVNQFEVSLPNESVTMHRNRAPSSELSTDVSESVASLL